MHGFGEENDRVGLGLAGLVGLSVSRPPAEGRKRSPREDPKL